MLKLKLEEPIFFMLIVTGKAWEIGGAFAPLTTTLYLNQEILSSMCQVDGIVVDRYPVVNMGTGML